MKKIIFITGVNGFIGRNLCKFLTKKDYIVYGIDNFFSSNKKDISELNSKNFLFKEKSILDQNIFDSFPGDIHLVIHLAAQTSVLNSIKDPLTNNKINIVGFENIFNQSQKKKIKNFFFASSSSVYGDNVNLPLTEKLSELKPLSPYAESKLQNENYIKKKGKVGGIIGLRLFNMYGHDPNTYTNSSYSAVIPKWINNFKKQKECKIYGDGTSMRDFCYISDLCELFELLINTNKTSGIFNFCTGNPCSILDLYNKIKSIFIDLGYEIKFPNPSFVKEKKGDIRYSYGSNDFLKKTFKFRFKTSLSSGLEKIIT